MWMRRFFTNDVPFFMERLALSKYLSLFQTSFKIRKLLVFVKVIAFFNVFLELLSLIAFCAPLFDALIISLPDSNAFGAYLFQHVLSHFFIFTFRPFSFFFIFPFVLVIGFIFICLIYSWLVPCFSI
jgi:hypothetical protein